MNKHWFLIFSLLLLTIGCSEPDVATIDKAAEKAVPDPVKVEAESENTEKPASTEKAENTASTENTENTASKGNTEAKESADSEPDANAVLKDAIAKAKADDKALFVHFSADW